MFNKVLPKRRSIVFTWLISYTLVLIVPVLISGINYIQSSKVLEKEINNSNNLSLRRIQNQMDTLIGDAERLSTEIALNPRISELMKLNSSVGSLSGYDIYQAVHDLGSYKIPNSSIDDYYIYFRNLDLVLSGYTGKDSQHHYDTYFSDTGVTFEQWKGMISGQYPSNYITSYATSVRGKENKNVVLIKTIPLNIQGNHAANIIITLDEARFMEDARDIEALSEGNVLILGSDNKIVAGSIPSTGIAGLKYEDMKDTGGMLHINLGNEKVVVSYASSRITNWKYVAIVPDSVFWRKLNYTRNMTIVSLLFCLIIGGVVTAVSLKKNYNPISRLVKLLEKDQGMNFDKRNNEYLFIQQVIDKLQSDKQRTDTILEQQNKELKAGLLARLLKGRVGGNLPAQDALSLHGIHFGSDTFAVMVFYIEDYSELFFQQVENQEPEDDFEKFKMVQFIVTNVIEEMVGQRNSTGYVTDIDDMLVCLINFGKEEAAAGKEEMTRIVQEAQAFLNKHFNINFITAVSTIHKTLTGIPEAYSEALQTLEYKKVLGIEEIIHYEDIIGMPKGDYYYPLEIERQLINSIKVGDFDNSKQILDDIFKKNFESTKLSLEIARCLVFDLVSTMIKTVNDVHHSISSELLKEVKPIERLLSCKSVAEMRREMTNILDVFCNYIKKAKSKVKNKDTDQQLAVEVTKFVQDNYMDVNLGVTAIAESFNVHIVHLSKTFKEQTGEGLADFITKIRLEKAKELLKELSSIEEVSNAVGYSNIRTFMRAFKKIEGITPGKFKELE